MLTMPTHQIPNNHRQHWKKYYSYEIKGKRLEAIRQKITPINNHSKQKRRREIQFPKQSLATKLGVKGYLWKPWEGLKTTNLSAQRIPFLINMKSSKIHLITKKLSSKTPQDFVIRMESINHQLQITCKPKIMPIT